MAKTAIILATALSRTKNANDSDKCLHQLIKGFGDIKNLVNKYPDSFDLYWGDNTVKSSLRYNNELVSLASNIPHLKSKKLFFNNYYNPDGSPNKGCGVVAIWHKILPKVINKNYDFVIHFEPRQEIKNFSFFDRFIKKPNSYFKTMRSQPDIRAWRKYFPPYVKREVWTGLFSCSTKVLLNYTNQKTSTGLNKLAEERFHVEGDLYNYLRENRTPFKPLSDLGLRWHDNGLNKKYTI